MHRNTVVVVNPLCVLLVFVWRSDTTTSERFQSWPCSSSLKTIV